MKFKSSLDSIFFFNQVPTLLLLKNGRYLFAIIKSTRVQYTYDLGAHFHGSGDISSIDCVEDRFGFPTITNTYITIYFIY